MTEDLLNFHYYKNILPSFRLVLDLFFCIVINLWKFGSLKDAEGK